jgi:CheY-like chemotaxis protein
MSSIKILVIDDNSAIHDAFKKIFQLEKNDTTLEALDSLLFSDKEKSIVDMIPPVEIDFAFQGKEALTLIQEKIEQRNPYALAFVDIRMPPGMDGIETIKKIWKIDAKLHIVICTAYSDYSLDEIHRQLGNYKDFFVLKKPFEVMEVRQMVYALGFSRRMPSYSEDESHEKKQ